MPEFGSTAIDPTQYQCGPTELDAWVAQRMAAFTETDLLLFDLLAVPALPMYEALAFGSASDPDFALTHDAKALEKTFRTLQRFSDIDGSGIELMAMHGYMLRDVDRVARTYEVLLRVDAATARDLATFVVDYLSAPRFEGGDHPVFTRNAFAFHDLGGEIIPGTTLSDRVVMGDGLLQAFDELGYGDVGPQAILAHEYGHHVQFALGMHDPGSEVSPEATRRTELHADAFAAYYLSHPRGASMQWKRVEEFLAAFHAIGDCYFALNGHHGTPNQRMAAGRWAYDLQEAARPKGHVLGSAAFRDLFDAALPRLVAPDA